MPTKAIMKINGRSMEEITASVRIHMRNMVNNALDLGVDLTEAKEACAHGEWIPWLKSVGISSSTAANYMRIAREIHADSKIAQLPYTKILALMAVPPEEREALADAAEDMSAAEIRRLTEERNRAAEAANTETARADQAEADAKQFSQEAASLRVQIQNMKENLAHAESERHKAAVDLTKMSQAYERQKKRIDQLHDELEQEHGKLLFAENNRIEVEVERVPEDYEAVKAQLATMEQQEKDLVNAAAEAEERAAAAEAELDALRAGETSENLSRTLRIAVNTFMTDCQTMPAHPEQLIRDRERVERNVKMIESWCAAMRDALTLHPVEGAVV